MPSTVIRFGTYEVDRTQGELRKNGTRIKIQDQPFRTLLLLLDHPGEVITRDELQHKLWADDTFVEFDKALSTAINKLREALGDDAGNPRFVETVPRRGYRFIAHVESVAMVRPLVVPLQVRTASPPLWRRAWFLALCAVLLAASAIAVYFALRSRPITARLMIPVPADLFFPSEAAVAISPDGETVVFIAEPKDGDRRLYRRRFDEWDAHEIPGTIGAKYPFFSPDGQWLAFWRRSTQGRRAGELVKISMQGGTPQTICLGWLISAGNWGRDDHILVPVRLGKLLRIPASPPAVQDCVQAEGLLQWTAQTSTSYLAVEPVPGKEAVLTTKRTPGKLDIIAISLKTRNEQVIVPGGMHPHLALRHLFFVADRSLKVVRFDPEKVATFGPVQVIAADLNDYPLDVPYAVAANGTVAILRGFGASRSLVWRDRTGRATPVAVNPRRYSNPALSPDRKRLAVSVQQGAVLRIWTGGTAGEPLSPLTSMGDEWYPTWAPDGKRIAFASGATSDGAYRVFWTAADGTGTAQKLAETPRLFPSSWSPKGDVLLAVGLGGPAKSSDIWKVYTRSAEAPQPFLNTEFGEQDAAFSPDGHWVAYSSNESGVAQVYVRAYAGAGAKQQISLDGGSSPTWRGDGREIFYLNREGTMMSVPTVPDELTLRVGTPKVLFRAPRTAKDIPRDYDVTTDGQRFLMVDRLDDATTRPQIDVVLGFVEALRIGVTRQKD